VIAPVLLLTLRGLKRWPTWLLTLLVLVSILQYLIGAMMMVFVHRQ
jgi:heme A synthase